MKEAQYNCCWNANYCNEACQQAHWPEHMKHCVQVHQNQSTPDPPPTPIPCPASIAGPTPTDPQPFFPPPRPGSTSTHIIMPHAIPPAAMATQQSPREMGGASEPLVQYAELAHTDPRSEHPGLDKAMSRIEQVPNDTSSLLNHQASQHMKTLLLQQAVAAQHQHSQQLQQHQPPPTPGQATGTLTARAGQHSAKNSVISGSTLIHHSPSVSLYQPLVAQVVDGSGAGTARDSSLPGGVPPPASPGSPASEHSSVHNPPGFSWPYQQPVIISSTDGYPMPLLPTLQPSSGSQQQHQHSGHQPYFKAF